MSSKAKAAHVWERDALDWYCEPERVTTQLCQVERFVGPIMDPCCGQGNIVRALRASGHDAIGKDIVERAGQDFEWFRGTQDFLTTTGAASAPNCVMNPPFFRAKGLESFIRKALERFPGKVCVFGDVRFIAGASRASGLFADHPPQRVWIITPRPSCPPGKFLADGGKAGNGSSDWCWMIWSKLEPAGDTRLGWLHGWRSP